MNEIINQDKYNEQALVLKEKVNNLEVIDKDTFEVMESIEKTAKDNIKALENHMKVQIEDAHQKHKKLTQLRNDLTSPFKDVAKSARSKCIAYASEQQRLARIEAQKQAELARIEAEEEKILLEAVKLEGEQVDEAPIFATPVDPIPLAIPEVKPTASVKGARTIISAQIVDFRLMCEKWSKEPPVLSERQKQELIRVLKLNDVARSCGANTGVVLPGLVTISRIV